MPTLCVLCHELLAEASEVESLKQSRLVSAIESGVWENCAICTQMQEQTYSNSRIEGATGEDKVEGIAAFRHEKFVRKTSWDSFHRLCIRRYFQGKFKFFYDLTSVESMLYAFQPSNSD